MAQTGESRWRSVARTLGEIAVVTIGILVAFALEAWWDDRATAREEQVHLRALATDLEQNVAGLERLIANEEAVMSSTEELLRRARGEPAGSDAPVGELVNSVFNSARYEPVMGAYEALVNSGGLALIQDEKLRAALAAYAADIRGRYEESWSDEHYFAFSREFAGPITLLAFGNEAGSVDDPVFEELLRNRRFQEHLAMRHFSERDMTNKYRRLLKQAEEVLARLRAQIRAR
jgi:hypothetical protein